MGPGIDFPMIMTYKDTENPNFEPYFYFLNGHNDVVYFTDSNFTEEKVESYEYNPWGILLTSTSRNNMLYTARDFDFDINLQFNRMRYYSNLIGRFVYRDFTSRRDFIYAYNSPSKYIDSFGLYGEDIPIFGTIQDYWNYCNESYGNCIDKCYEMYPVLNCFEEFFNCKSKYFVSSDGISAVDLGCLSDCSTEWDACIKIREKYNMLRRDCINGCIFQHLSCMFRLIAQGAFWGPQ